MNTREATQIVERVKKNERRWEKWKHKRWWTTAILPGMEPFNSMNDFDLLRNILTPMIGPILEPFLKGLGVEDELVDRKLKRLMKHKSYDEIMTTIRRKILENEFCDNIQLEIKSNNMGGETIIDKD